MKPNMGSADRIVRIVVALIVVALYFMNQISGTTAIVLLILSGIFILTSFISFCPLLPAKRKTNNNPNLLIYLRL
jgi:lipopolysaccharide export LptBFGC system permease protein LptF